MVFEDLPDKIIKAIVKTTVKGVETGIKAHNLIKEKNLRAKEKEVNILLEEAVDGDLELYREGRKHYKNGDYDNAIYYLKESIRKGDEAKNKYEQDE